MNVRLVGGPFDGEEHDVSSASLQERGVFYVSAHGNDREVSRVITERPPGETGIVEYVYDGDGRASYVAGLPDAGA
jgi:hypothetical protein